MERIQTLTKYAGESRDYDFNFKNLLDSSDTITAISSITTSVVSGTNTTNISTSSGTVNSPSVQTTISSGTSGVTYEIKCTVTTNNGETLVAVGHLRVL